MSAKEQTSRSYIAEDGKSLSIAEVCRRLGLPLERAPMVFVEPILPTIEERIAGGMLEAGAPLAQVDIRERRYFLRSRW